MNYEKAYKEALERARQFSENPLEEDSSSIVKYIFPELKESDDERIRKVLIDYFNRYKEQEECGIKTFFGIPTDNILAWLEKQGTSYTKRDVDDAFIEKAVKHIDGLIEFLNELGHQLKKERIIEDF